MIKILILFLFYISLFAQGEWEKVNSPVDKNLNSIFIYDSLHIWIAGAEGTILFSPDAGRNWTVQNSGIEYPWQINDIQFTDTLNGWAVATNNLQSPYGSTFLKTSDGGETWISFIYPDEFTFLYTIYFFNSDTGFAAGTEGKIFKTTDGGNQWKLCPIDSGGGANLSILDLKFSDESNGFASGGHFDAAGVIWRSTNGGESWWSVIVDPDPINELVFVDSSIYGIGGDLENTFPTAFVKSEDMGMTWILDTISHIGVASSISFRNPAEGWISLRNRKFLLHTADSGKTWTDLQLSDSTYIFDLEFSDSLTGIACGLNGEIYKWKKKFIDVQDYKVNELSEFTLYNNFPNPFNPSTVIMYKIPSAGEVKIFVYNNLGQLLEQNTSFQNPGLHTRTLSLHNEPSGIYFYVVESAGVRKTGKMLLLK